jgi:hypothetical protein
MKEEYLKCLITLLDLDADLDLIDGDTYFYLQGICNNLNIELKGDN